MRVAVAIAVLLGLSVEASANGRPPQVLNLYFRPGADAEVRAPATFGLLSSIDSGDTWRWTCETAIGYGGTYDPDYAVSPTGTVFATTFDGLRVNRGGSCTWDLAPFGETFAANVEVGADGTVYVAISFAGNPTTTPPIPPDYKFYRSTNDGVSFDAGTVVDPIGTEWWQSLASAPSDPDILYMTGHRLEGGTMRRLLMYRSANGGQSWSPIAVAGFTTTERTNLEVVAIHPTDPDRVLLRVTDWRDVIGDDFWLTTNGGQSWTNVLRLNNYGFGVYRANGDAVIATPGDGVYRSTDGGANFELVPPPGPGPDAAIGLHPYIYCLRENGAGELWACTQNLAQPPFDAGVMKTTDLASWTKVLEFETDIVGPQQCAAGTIQEDCCTHLVDACEAANPPGWCLLAIQLGIMDPECAIPDAGTPDAGGMTEPKTCCGASDPAGTGLLVVIVTAALRRRRYARR